MSTEYYIVSLSDYAFFTIVASALEAYKVSHPESNKPEHRPIETYGNLWGYQANTKRNETVFRVVLADVDTSAKRTPESVSPEQNAFNIKVRFIDAFMPELEYLGDFHSHPYNFKHDRVKSVLALERAKLYCFSPEDFNCVRHLQKNEKRNYRLGIVTTVFEIKKGSKRKNMHIDKNLNCIRFMYDNMSIWIKAHVFTGQKFNQIEDEYIGLICPILGFHIDSIEQK